MTTTDKKKIEVATARALLSDKLMAYKTTHFNKATLKHWTFGEDHAPVADEIIVEDENKKARVIFGVKYDAQGYVMAVYETDFKGKITYLPFSAEVKTTTKNNKLTKRIDEVKAKEAKSQTKVEVKKTTKRVTQTRKVIPQRDSRLS